MKRTTLPKSLALPAATLGALAATSASGAIVYSGALDVTVAEGSNQSIYFDLGTGSAWKQADSPTTPWSISLQAISEDSAHGVYLYSNMGEVSTAFRTVTNSPYAFFSRRFATDDSISSALASNWNFMGGFLADTGNPAFKGEWTNNGTRGFLALNWTTPGSGGSDAQLYGWAQVSYNADRSVTLHDFAYEATPDTAIQAGAIPEPSTYAALAGLLAGSAALYARRRRKAA